MTSAENENERGPREGSGSGSRQQSRRELLLTGMGGIAAAALSGAGSSASAAEAKTKPVAPTEAAASSTTGSDTAPAPAFTEYRGPLSLGFSFSYPTEGWSVKKKPIKTHMSEIVVSNTSGRPSSSAGVTVDAVTIAKIADFGTADDVGRKVLAVETKKDSVLSAELLGTSQMGQDGLTFYVIKYAVDGGRGLKRYVAKATITGGNLYVFTAQAKADDFSGEDGAALSGMLDSFYVKPQFI